VSKKLHATLATPRVWAPFLSRLESRFAVAKPPIVNGGVFQFNVYYDDTTDEENEEPRPAVPIPQPSPFFDSSDDDDDTAAADGDDEEVELTVKFQSFMFSDAVAEIVPRYEGPNLRDPYDPRGADAPLLVPFNPDKDRPIFYRDDGTDGVCTHARFFETANAPQPQQQGAAANASAADSSNPPPNHDFPAGSSSNPRSTQLALQNLFSPQSESRWDAMGDEERVGVYIEVPPPHVCRKPQCRSRAPGDRHGAEFTCATAEDFRMHCSSPQHSVDIPLAFLDPRATPIDPSDFEYFDPTRLYKTMDCRRRVIALTGYVVRVASVLRGPMTAHTYQIVPGADAATPPSRDDPTSATRCDILVEGWEGFFDNITAEVHSEFQSRVERPFQMVGAGVNGPEHFRFEEPHRRPGVYWEGKLTGCTHDNVMVRMIDEIVLPEFRRGPRTRDFFNPSAGESNVLQILRHGWGSVDFEYDFTFDSDRMDVLLRAIENDQGPPEGWQEEDEESDDEDEMWG
jgi:hypothetical protein